MGISRVESIRQGILDDLYGNRPLLRDAEKIVRAQKRDGEWSDVMPAEVERECQYLAGKGYVIAAHEEIAQAHKRWTITAAGIDFLERNGLI